MEVLPLPLLVTLAVIYVAGMIWVVGTSLAGFMIQWGGMAARPGSMILDSARRAIGVSVASAAALYVFDLLLRWTGIL